MGRAERIVILNDFSAVRGGATYLARMLAEGVACKHRKVTMIVGDDGPEAPVEGVEFVALGGRALLKRHPVAAAIGGLYDQSIAQRLSAWIERHDTPSTIYHLHNWTQILSISVFDALKPLASRVVVHAHDFFLACPNGAFFDYGKREACTRVPLSTGCILTQCDKHGYAHKLWRVARHSMLSGALQSFVRDARFILINEAMGPLLARSHSPQSVSVVPNPVSPFGPASPDPAGQRNFAFIGQIQELKGVFEIAEAARESRVTVEFFGGGDALGELAQRYPEHIYHGWTPRPAIGAALSRIRACIVGTLSPEPFCLSAFEAIATGVPVIVSERILAAESLTQSGAAISYPPTDIAALSAILSDLDSNDERLRGMAAAARRNGAGLSLSVDDWITEHLRIYDTLSTGIRAGAMI